MSLKRKSPGTRSCEPARSGDPRLAKWARNHVGRPPDPSATAAHSTAGAAVEHGPRSPVSRDAAGAETPNNTSAALQRRIPLRLDISVVVLMARIVSGWRRNGHGPALRRGRQRPCRLGRCELIRNCGEVAAEPATVRSRVCRTGLDEVVDSARDEEPEGFHIDVGGHPPELLLAGEIVGHRAASKERASPVA